MKFSLFPNLTLRKFSSPAFALSLVTSALFTPQIAMASAGTTAVNYDGDAREDIAFRRASSFETIISRSTDGQTQRVTFGRRAGDIPVVGDFDGDGINDVAVRRASVQIWYIQNSGGVDLITENSDGITRFNFGLQMGDIPVAADYDGDGITDIAVRRPSNQIWYIHNSSGVDAITGNDDGITRRRFGTQEGDIPVPADYDGDGKADLAVRRPGTQFWYILNSSGVDRISGYSDGITRRRFGTQEADIPVPADYDGDGRADLAVRRPNVQFWYVLNSSGVDNITDNADGITRRRFGTQEADIPVPADYDGDGKADLAVRRAATSQWFVLNSSGNDMITNNGDGITRLTFGTETTDQPLAQPLNSIWTSSDIDEDGLTKAEEDLLGTNFMVADSDSDGLLDGDEANTYETDPLATDSDGDGLSDSDEVTVYSTSPTQTDSDNDGLSDAEEINTHNTDPNNADSDGDGVTDGDEIIAGTDPNAKPKIEFSESALIASIVDTVYIPTFELFAQRALEMDSAIDAYCAALPNDSNNNRGTAQNEWKDAMDTWQMVELMQVGPLLDDNSKLRNSVYSWPNRRDCFVDQDVVAAEGAGYNISSRNVSRKGMDALEYLLFDNDLDHKCTVPGTEPGGWNDRTVEDRTVARCDFAAIVSSDVVSNANAIVSAWAGDNGYGNTLKNAGNAGSNFTTSLEAINDISDGLFYFTGLMKDGKIATPLGLRANNCGLTACPDDAESPHADYSLQNIINNMKALRMLLVGSSDSQLGFVDFLEDVGDNTTAINIITSLDDAISLAEGFSGTYSELLIQASDSVEQLHTEVNEVDDIIKSDFINSLALELPSTSAGDND